MYLYLAVAKDFGFLHKQAAQFFGWLQREVNGWIIHPHTEQWMDGGKIKFEVKNVKTKCTIIRSA